MKENPTEILTCIRHLLKLKLSKLDLVSTEDQPYLYGYRRALLDMLDSLEHLNTRLIEFEEDRDL